MTKQRDWTSTISGLTGWLVGLLATIAFVLSYNALRHVAVDNGVPIELSYAWPLLVDFALIVFSLAVLRSNLLGERTLWHWTLVGFFTLLTIGFNLVHAPGNLTSQIVAVVAPVALFLSFESLMSMIKSSVKRQSAIQAIEQLYENIKALDAQLNAKKNELTAEAKAVQVQIDNLTFERDRLTTELSTLRNVKRAELDEKSKEVGVSTDKVEAARDVMLRYTLEGLTLPSGAQLGRELGVTRTTGNKLKSLIEPEFVHVNGNGKVNGKLNGSIAK